MKIKIINPDFGMTNEEIDERLNILQNYVSADTILNMECLKTNEVYIDSMLDIVLAGSEIVSMAKKAQDDGYDAVVIYCFSDPAVSACREILDIPVIGGGQAAYLTSLAISRHFGIIVTDNSRIGEKKLFVHETGVASERILSIRTADFKGKGIREDFNYSINCLVEAGTQLINDGAEAIVLGCLSFLNMGETLSERLAVPVIDAAIASVSMAESLARQKLKTSKLSYAVPPKGKRNWEGGSFTV